MALVRSLVVSPDPAAPRPPLVAALWAGGSPARWVEIDEVGTDRGFHAPGDRRIMAVRPTGGSATEAAGGGLLERRWARPCPGPLREQGPGGEAREALLIPVVVARPRAEEAHHLLAQRGEGRVLAVRADQGGHADLVEVHTD